MKYRDTQLPKPKPMSETMAMRSIDSPMYPRVSLPLHSIPEAKSWEIGDTYEIAIRVKQTGINTHKGSDGKEHGNVDFELTGISVIGESKSPRYKEK